MSDPSHARPVDDTGDFVRQVAGLQGYLLRFALMQLRNPAWAEDAVSETTVAALKHPQGFAGRAQLKTYLIGILKHKVIDQLRLHQRTWQDERTPDEAHDPVEDLAFLPDGHYATEPSAWGNPEQDLQQQQFLQVLQVCVDKLPPVQGRLFLMREWLELSCEDICKELTLTPTNLYVQLHRARLRLRECLDMNWFTP